MRRSPRVHIFGASGSGTTTLGAALAGRLGLLHLDVDDFYWRQTDPPFQEKNEPAVRVEQIRDALGDNCAWVLSGSLVSWGEALLPEFTLAVFLEIDATERMARLLRRERERHGARIAPAGDMHEGHMAFMEWARAYDTASGGQRCRKVHDAWMAGLECPVMTLDSAGPIDDLVEAVARAAT